MMNQKSNYSELNTSLQDSQRSTLKKTTLIIGVRLDEKTTERLENLLFLIRWMDHYFGDLVDVLIIEQDSKPKIDVAMFQHRRLRYQFIYNPDQYNRGWGFNVAVKEFCRDFDIAVFMDTDILPGTNFIDSILSCGGEYDFVSPYTNIYYANSEEASNIRASMHVNFAYRKDGLSNPVTISGGILICKISAFKALWGYEQYMGYAGEDRALDVTLLNYVNPERICIRSGAYIHLYHERDAIDRSRTPQILEHLVENYECKWQRSLEPTDYIHAECKHVSKKELLSTLQLKSISFGDKDLYLRDVPLSINGQVTGCRYEYLEAARLPVINRMIQTQNFDLINEFINEAIVHYRSAQAPSLITALEQKKNQVKKLRVKSGIVDFLFIPHKKYHTAEFSGALLKLVEAGYICKFLSVSPPHPDEGAYDVGLAEHFIGYSEFINGNYFPRVIVVANDWERPVAQPIIEIANHFNIPTVAVVEGVNDFFDVDVRIPGSTAHFRNAYRTCKSVMLNGNFDRKYFANSSQNIRVTGISRLENLGAYRARRDKNARNGKILVNSNFSYGVKKLEKSQWLSSVHKISAAFGKDVIVSKHPQDAPFEVDYKISNRSLLEELTECELFITRFSGAVFEALVIGCPVIYYNPGFEHVDKFREPLGAFVYAKSEQALQLGVAEILGGAAFNVDNFLREHADLCLQSSQGGLESAPTKLSRALEEILVSATFCKDAAERYKKCLADWVLSGNSLVTNIEKYLPNSRISDYFMEKNVVLCRCLNVDIDQLEHRLVIFSGKIYQLVPGRIGYELRAISAELWNLQIALKSDEICIHETDIDFSSIRVTGFVFDIWRMSVPLRPGASFLIRAKNERENIFFVLGSLKPILKNRRFNSDVVFVDNNSQDGTYEEVIRVCRELQINNVFLYKYKINISRSGDEHSRLHENNEMYRSLDTYYNWCLDKSGKFNVIKWDADFLGVNDNLVELFERYDLANTSKPLAIWFAGKTLYKNKERFYVNQESGYNEFRVFSKLCGYRWEYAPRWEISSRDFLQKCAKSIFAKSVYLELKDVGINEFEHRTGGKFIDTCARDVQDNRLLEIIRSEQPISDEDLASCGLVKGALIELGFNPLTSINWDTVAFNEYECSWRELEGMQTYWLNDYSRSDGRVSFVNPGNVIIQGLWVGERVTSLHRMCIESFLKQGHCYVLYVYGPVENVPPGVVLMDANKLVPSSLIYSFDGSYAGFSDLFRSKLLLARGGWYVDLDIFCFKRFDIQSPMVFSLDHYPENGPKVINDKGMQIFPIRDKYYCATNPIKMPAGHPMAKAVYSKVFRKILAQKVSSELFQSRRDILVSPEELSSFVERCCIRSDFEAYFFSISSLIEPFSFEQFLRSAGFLEDEVGQKMWNEIGPRLVSEQILEFGLDSYLFLPSFFQGSIPYYEVEKFIDPTYDFKTRLQADSGYSIDLFFTMWRNRGLLDKKDHIDGTLYKHLESLVAESPST